MSFLSPKVYFDEATRQAICWWLEPGRGVDVEPDYEIAFRVSVRAMGSDPVSASGLMSDSGSVSREAWESVSVLELA